MLNNLGKRTLLHTITIRRQESPLIPTLNRYRLTTCWPLKKNPLSLSVANFKTINSIPSSHFPSSLLMTRKNMDYGSMDPKWYDFMLTLIRSVGDGDYIQTYCISIVPEALKQSNKNDDAAAAAAYMPRVVSMGPRFKGSREDLLLMEEVKLRCVLSLVHRADDARHFFEKCSREIWRLEPVIRASYVADISHINKRDLVKIMLVDGCFLLELLISKGSLNDHLRSRLIDPPPPAPQVLLNEDVLSDLILFENQIPICVLHVLCQTLFPQVFEEYYMDRAKRINNLALSIFGYDQLPPDHQTSSAPHILDVVHFFVNTKESKSTTNHDQSIKIDANHVPSSILKLKRCASRLRAAGVTIRIAEETNSGLCCFSFLRSCFGGLLIWLGNTIMYTRQVVVLSAEEELLTKGLDFEFNFEKGKLVVAQLHIKKTTRATWRNIIAWEHHKKGGRSSPNGKFTLAALIFDGLICCTADLKLLKDKNVIVDHTKMSNEELQDFFHTMSFGLDHGVVDSRYFKMVDGLNNYTQACFIIRMWRIFWHVFRSGFEWLYRKMWKNYNFVASLVTFLTIVQTLYALLDYYLPNN